VNTSWLDLSLRKASTASITGYQKYISPHKGFACAHRLLYGGESCSGHVKRLIAQDGLILGIRASKKRFQACREAKEILQSRCLSMQGNRHRRNLKHHCCDGVDCVDCGCEFCDVGDCNLDLPDCDCSPDLDCGALDCGSGCDFGSCS
jgi:putative component of membrane protein insertase Oxa1/YidC/SpoIIIJ protein YidD